MPPDPYVRTLVEGLGADKEDVDRRIAAASVGWPLDRMAVIDRIVLRLAVAELLDPEGPPVAVVIDEAVELAKTYSTDDSGRFVNGILSTIAADIRLALTESCPDREVGPVRPTRQEEQWPNANAVTRDPSGACSWPTPRS